jgi:transcriptional regulator of acetoin/glycerol metabolism
LRFAFVEALLTYDWPFNVRELEAAVRRAVAVADGAPLEVRHLPPSIASVAPPAYQTETESLPPLRESSPPSARPSAATLSTLLLQHRGNVAALARDLGKDRTQVHRWLRQLGLDPNTFR